MVCEWAGAGGCVVAPVTVGSGVRVNDDRVDVCVAVVVAALLVGGCCCSAVEL